MSAPEEDPVVARIREELARRPMSREQLAHRASVSKSTVDKLMTGAYSPKTVAKIEEALGVPLQRLQVVSDVAPDWLGGYARSDVEIYLGDYELIRPDTTMPGRRINIYAMAMDWDEGGSRLRMIHHGIERSRYRQFGVISVPEGQPYIFVVSSDGGWHQSCILERISFTRDMSGLMFGLNMVSRANLYRPVVVPMALVGYEGERRATRAVTQSDEEFAALSARLEIAGELSQSFL